MRKSQNVSPLNEAFKRGVMVMFLAKYGKKYRKTFHQGYSVHFLNITFQILQKLFLLGFHPNVNKKGVYRELNIAHDWCHVKCVLGVGNVLKITREDTIQKEMSPIEFLDSYLDSGKYELALFEYCSITNEETSKVEMTYRVSQKDRYGLIL